MTQARATSKPDARTTDHRDGGIAELLRLAAMCAESENPGVRAVGVACLRRAALLEAGEARVELLSEDAVERIVARVEATSRTLLVERDGLWRPTRRPTPGVN